MRHKSELLQTFKEFKAFIEKQSGNKIKALKSDNVNRDFTDFLKSEGITYECSAPYTPQQNKRTERDMRTIVESARTMLISRNVPQELWSEAVNTAVYILNK